MLGMWHRQKIHELISGVGSIRTLTDVWWWNNHHPLRGISMFAQNHCRKRHNCNRIRRVGGTESCKDIRNLGAAQCTVNLSSQLLPELEMQRWKSNNQETLVSSWGVWHDAWYATPIDSRILATAAGGDCSAFKATRPWAMKAHIRWGERKTIGTIGKWWWNHRKMMENSNFVMFAMKTSWDNDEHKQIS